MDTGPRITPEQFQTLQETAERSFEERLGAQLRTRYADVLRPWSPAQLNRFVSAAVETGRSLGLTWASSLSAFAALSVVIGPRFHQHPAIRAILEEPDDTPDKRLLRLPAMVPDAVWAEARLLSAGLQR